LIRLIGIDVDGTLVGSSGTVHPAIWAAAERARAAGIHLTLCSGRPAFGNALAYAQRLEPDGWHVFQNGASVVHLGTRESRSVELPSGIVPALIARARETGDLLELYSDRSYVAESASPWAREHAGILGVPFEPRPFESFAEPIVRAQWLVSPAQAERLMSAPSAGLECAQSTSPLMPEVRFVGFTRAGVSKGSAMQAVAAAYEVTLDDVMYVGDANNDLSALRIVGCPVAMGNADPAVIRVAKRTVGHVDTGALAEALEWALTS
jgi:Cof subfamily protein (haloacid dehalogenase superfamily)